MSVEEPTERERLAHVRELHSAARDYDGEVASGQGWTNGGYGYITPACQVCGTSDEYAEPWPCATYLAAGGSPDDKP